MGRSPIDGTDVFARYYVGDGGHLVIYIREVVTEQEENIRESMYREEGMQLKVLLKIPSNGL